MRQRPTEADCRRLDRPDLDPKSAQWPRLERPLSRNPLIFPSPSARVPTWRRALSFSEAVDGLGGIRADERAGAHALCSGGAALFFSVGLSNRPLLAVNNSQAAGFSASRRQRRGRQRHCEDQAGNDKFRPHCSSSFSSFEPELDQAADGCRERSFGSGPHPTRTNAAQPADLPC
jgi:hypothetical protein